MSRTYRRKNASHLDWSDDDWSEKERQQHVARFHGDRRSGLYNAPKHFRECRNKIRRAKDDADMIKALKRDDMEFIGSPPKRDVNWIWF